MGIQINGNTNNINAGIGSLSIEDLREIDIVGVATASNFKTGSSNLHSTGLTVGNNFLHSTGINVGTGATIHVPASNTLTFGTNSNERFRIASNGHVAIGTDSPNSALPLTIAGQYPGIQFKDNQGTTDFNINADSSAFRIQTGTAGAGPSEKLRVGNSGQIGLSGANYGSSGQVLTSQGSGSAATWTTISGTTINGNTDDYIITASGTANTLNGESNLIFTGSRLGINPSGGTITDIPATAHDTVVLGNSSATSGGITLEGASGSGNLAFQMYKQGGQPCARFMYERSSNSVRFDSATGSAPGSGEALRMRLHPDGDVEIADGDLIIGTSGHGIDFGATANGGTGTPNEIFDDYEEGSWTPAIEGLSNTPSFHNLGGNYTKIGNRVFLQCHIQINGSNKPQFSNQSAAFKISGLPFSGSSIAGGGYFGAHGVCVWQQLQWVGGSYSSYGHGDDTQLSPGIVDGGTRITLQTCGQGIYYTGQLLNRALHNNYAPNIEFDMSYRTAT